MIYTVSKKIAAVYYDGTNGAEILELVQNVLTPMSGNVWDIASEDESGIGLSESNPWYTYYWPVISAGHWLIADTSNSLTWTTDEPFMAQYTRYKDIFLAAANDPEVIAALRIALGLDSPEGS